VGQHYERKEKHSLYLYNYLEFPSRLRILCLIILVFNTRNLSLRTHASQVSFIKPIEVSALCSEDSTPFESHLKEYESLVSAFIDPPAGSPRAGQEEVEVTAPIEFANYRINSIRTNFELDRIVFVDS
jgi:hypothetical protein